MSVGELKTVLPLADNNYVVWSSVLTDWPERLGFRELITVPPDCIMVELTGWHQPIMPLLQDFNFVTVKR